MKIALTHFLVTWGDPLASKCPVALRYIVSYHFLSVCSSHSLNESLELGTCHINSSCNVYLGRLVKGKCGRGWL